MGIWTGTDQEAEEIVQKVFEKEYEKSYKASTVNTLIKRLVAAGYVIRGGQYIAHCGYPYFPKISEEEYVGQQLAQYQKEYFSGSAADFIVSLLRTQEISPKERDQIQECIDELRKEDGR